MQFVKTPLYNMHVRIKQGVHTVDSLHLKPNRYMMPIMLATVHVKMAVFFSSTLQTESYNISQVVRKPLLPMRRQRCRLAARLPHS